MATYLITWNPKRFPWYDLKDDCEAISLGFQDDIRWSCGNTKKIRTGDRVFLMRLGKQPKGIMLSGWVSEEPFPDFHWNDNSRQATALYISIRPEVLLDPDLHILLDPEEISTDMDWYPQRSGVNIPEEIASKLELRWTEHLVKNDIHINGNYTADDFAQNETFLEGKKRQISVNQFERNPRARTACIEYYGDSCIVCGFSFWEYFGEIGDGFIHVHHLKPLSDISEAYEIDPIQDLRPVCPNCHAMLHRRNPPYTIEELRELLAFSLVMDDEESTG